MSTFKTLFSIGMWWRILYGCLRIVLGLALLHAIGQPLIEIVTAVMQHEILAKSPDFIFILISHFLTEHQFSVTYFLSFYFIFWGTLDIFLSFHMLKDNIWAFPVSLVLIGLFIVYSIFRFTYTHSLVLLGVIAMDMVILGLIYKEYQRIRAYRAAAAEISLATSHTIHTSEAE